jgi:predicted ATPase
LLYREGEDMKILQLDIEGFRSLKKVTWKPGDLNVVIGPNGSGKSNLLRFLELMSVSAHGRLGKYIQSLGGMEPIVWDGQATSISVKVKTFVDAGNTDPQRDAITYLLELPRLGTSSFYRIQREILAKFYEDDIDQQSQSLKILERIGLNGHILNAERRAIFATEDSLNEEETFLSMASGPFASNLLVKRFQQELGSWKIYHDTEVHQNAILRQPAVARFEKRVDPDGQNLIPVLHTLYDGDRDFKKDINSAMRAAFGDDFEELIFPPAADQRIQLRVRWKSLKREQSAADLSDGTLRFLLLLTILASPSPPPLIAIDEPETGLRPSMLPIIAEYAVDAATRTQVIFTTHSPQFLDAFTDTKPTTTMAKWENGETTLNVLGGEQLDYWLKEYSLGALFKSGELEGME